MDLFRPIQEGLVLQHRSYSSLNLFQWRLLLAEHPDILFKSFILEGVQAGSVLTLIEF